MSRREKDSQGKSRPQRLDKVLSREGLGTRSELKKAIRGGRVLVNGETEKDPGRQISGEDELVFDGRRIRSAQHVYYMLNKPAGVITATEDSELTTVMDLLRNPDVNPDCPGRLDAAGQEIPAQGASPTAGGRPVLRRGLFPVGRLDRDTEGLLLITDDGDLAHQLLSPGRHVDKKYYVVVTGTITREDIQRFAQGLKVDEEFTAMPALLRVIQKSDPEWDAERDAEKSAGAAGQSQAVVTVHEGKFHQIKRMFAAAGKKVLYLKRVSMGTLSLDPSLAPGQFRSLTDEELSALRHGRSAEQDSVCADDPSL